MMNKHKDLVVEKLLQLISHQTHYIDQLKKEKDGLLGELRVFKQRLVEVIDENQSIHDDMQAKVVSRTLDCSHAVMEETMKSNQDPVSSPDLPPPPNLSQTKWKQPTGNPSVWKQELLELKSFYDSKQAGLETQMNVTKKNLQKALDENEQLRSRLHQQSSPPLGVPSKGDPSPSIQMIERLTSERDDLMKSVTSLRASLSQAQHVETELRQEVQKSLAALEDIQLDKTKVLVEREQLSDSLQKIHKKLEVEIDTGHKRALDAATYQRALCTEEINNLQRKVGELMASCSHYEESLSKCAKEKSVLLIQVEESRAQLLQSERDNATLKMEVQHEVKSALKGYNGAELELRDARTKLESELLKAKQERSRYEQESVELHHRLEASEIHGLKTQELNVALTSQLNDVLGKMERIKQDNLQIRKQSKEELERVNMTSSEKVESLTKAMNRAEVEYEQRLSDVEGICGKQHEIIKKLRSECSALEGALTHLGGKHRVEVGELTQKMEQMKVRLTRLTSKNKELSKQCVRHGVTHRQMQERLLAVNNRARVSTTQILQLLDRQEQTAREKKVLNDEVEFLQSQVMDQRDNSMKTT